MTKPLPTTVQGIGGLLRKAGFTPSVTTTTRIRGWHNHSYGFKIKRTDLDFVGVRYVAKLDCHTGRRDGSEEEMLAAISKTLTEAGYAVARGDFYTPSDHTHTLWISAEGFR